MADKDERWQTRLQQIMDSRPEAVVLLQAGMELERLRARTGGLHAVVAGLKALVDELERGLADVEADVQAMDEALDAFAAGLTGE